MTRRTTIVLPERPRVKLIPLKSTWTCPNCQYQNVYDPGIVSRAQNSCTFCHTAVELGERRQTDKEKNKSKETTISEAASCLVAGAGCAIVLAGLGIGIAAIIWVLI